MSKTTDIESIALQKGAQAAQLHEMLNDYFINSEQNLKNTFAACTFAQKDDMVAINMQLRALKQLKSSITYYINTGKIVQEKLDKEYSQEH